MLFSALSVSNSGLQAASAFIDVLGNNVANVSTTAYKSSQVSFRDLVYSGLAPGAASQGITPPGGLQLGNGAVVDAVTGLFTQGALNPTGRTLDVGINGPGFFAVTLPDGSTAYTRAGDLQVDSAGNLVTADGLKLAPGLTLAGVTGQVSIGSDGTVTAVTSTGTQTFGQLTLTRFVNPGGLTRVGDNLFVQSGAEGAATTGVPGVNGLGNLQPESLEGSNVDIGAELTNLLVAQRAFQFNSRAIQVESDVLAATTDLIQ